MPGTPPRASPCRRPGPATAPGARRQSRTRAAGGFTLVELLLAAVIVAILLMLAVPAYHEYRELARVAQAVTDIGAIAAAIANSALELRELPASLREVGLDGMRDPWGNAYQYVSHADPGARGAWRKDKNIVPINTDFDVFSMGKDGESVPPPTARASRDDIVRANSGRYIGLASDYDP
jgi:general secretion pathway protein G